MGYDSDEAKWEDRCPECQHYLLAEHNDTGCNGFDPDRYDATCPCLLPADTNDYANPRHDDFDPRAAQERGF